jgi:beta-glucuronidase
MMMKKVIPAWMCLFVFLQLQAQTSLVTNIAGRKTVSLNGKWQYIVDPYETGNYDYRYKERRENDREAYWNSDVPENKTDRKEHGYLFSLAKPGPKPSAAFMATA